MNSTRDVHRYTAPLPVGAGAGVGSEKRRAIQKKLKINGFWLIEAGTDDHSPMPILWVIVSIKVILVIKVIKVIGGDLRRVFIFL
jgi:hypothetical protein